MAVVTAVIIDYRTVIVLFMLYIVMQTMDIIKSKKLF